jgi:sugar-specific transcriptional regulator TrmB
MHIQSETIQKLIQFGLSEDEARIYLYLIGKKPQTALEISRALAVPRTSVYDHTRRLLENGLIEKVVEYKRSLFKCSSLDALHRVVHEYTHKANQLQAALTNMEQLFRGNSLAVPQTEVRYYEGVEGHKQIMWNSLRAEKEMYGYSTYGRREVVGEQFMKRYTEEFRARGLADSVIINPAKETLDYIKKYIVSSWHHQKFYNIRWLPKEVIDISGDTMIYNSVFAVSYWRKSEVVGVEIENPEFVKTQKTIFKTLWKQAKPIKVLIKRQQRE